MEKEIIVGLGEILWDVFPDRKVLGGAPANFAHHVSQLGYEGYAVSAIGKDDLGEEIRRTLAGRELNLLAEEVPFPTGTVQVSLDAQGVPQYEIREGVAWDNIPFTERLLQLAKKTKVVCFGSLAQRNGVSRSTIKAYLDALPVDALKVFDINLRQQFYTRQVLEDSLRCSDVLKINDEEVAAIGCLWGWENKTEQDVCRSLLCDYDLRMVVMTCGTQGSYVFTSADCSFLPTPQVEVVDTVGAGDSFTAAFIASLLYGKNMYEAHRLAVDVSAYVCTCQGGMPTLPEELKRRVKG